MKYAVCTARCSYCGRLWRPLIEVSETGGFSPAFLECPRCRRTTGCVHYVFGIEDGEEAARARAESLMDEGH